MMRVPTLTTAIEIAGTCCCVPVPPRKLTCGRKPLGISILTPQRVTWQVEFEKPHMSVDVLFKYGRMLVDEQENVRRVQLADSYMSGAELAGASGKSMPDEIIREVIEDLGEERGGQVIKEMEKKIEAQTSK